MLLFLFSFRVLFSLILLAFNSELFAQEGSCKYKLHGTTMDEHNRQSLPFTKIFSKTHNQFFESNEEGTFLIQNFCPGKHLLRFIHPFCDTLDIEIMINNDTSFLFYLEHHQKILKTVEITARNSEVNATQSVHRMEESDKERTKGMSLAEGLQKISGVTTLNSGPKISKPVIHGLYGNRVLLMINGLRHESQQWGNDHAPEIDPFLAGEIEVVKGAMGVRYGSDAIGGVIMIEPKDIPTDKALSTEWNSVFHSNGLMTANSLMVSGTKKNMGYRLLGTYKKAGNSHAPGYTLDNTGMEEKNFSYQFNYKNSRLYTEIFYSWFSTKIGIYRGAHIGNLTDLQNILAGLNQPIDAPFTYSIGRPYQSVLHELFKGKVSYRLGAHSNINLVYGRQYNNRDEFDVVRRSRQTNAPELNFEITTHTAEALLNLHNDEGFVIHTGVWGLYQFNTYEGRFFIPNFINRNVAGFAIGKWIQPSFTLELGTRYDYKTTQAFFYQNQVLQKPYLTFSNLSYNASGIYHVSSKSSVLLSLASGWRAPGVNELYSNGLHHGAASIEIGNPYLKTEKVYSVTLNHTYIDKWIQITNELFFNYFGNYIYLKPRSEPILTIRGAFPAFEYSQCRAVFSGYDLLTRINFNRNIFLKVKSSVLYAQNISEGIPVPLVPSNRINASFNYEKSYSDFTVLFSLEGNGVAQQTRYLPKSDYAPPPPAYTIYHTHIDFKDLWKKRLTIGLSVFNLLNKAYRDYTSRFRYFIDETGRNFSLRITLKI